MPVILPTGSNSVFFRGMAAVFRCRSNSVAFELKCRSGGTANGHECGGLRTAMTLRRLHPVGDAPRRLRSSANSSFVSIRGFPTAEFGLNIFAIERSDLQSWRRKMWRGAERDGCRRARSATFRARICNRQARRYAICFMENMKIVTPSQRLRGASVALATWLPSEACWVALRGESQWNRQPSPPPPTSQTNARDSMPKDGSEYQRFFGPGGAAQSARESFINARFTPRGAVKVSRLGRLFEPRRITASDPVNVACLMISPPYASLAA